MIIVAITGASGVIYALKFLEALKRLGVKTGLVISDPGKIVIGEELDLSVSALEDLADEVFDFNDLTASINSGSFKFRGLVIVPCSMKTLSSIANGFADNTISRVGDVALKEHRKMVIVPRETPLRSVHIENMLKISREGGIVLPAMPAYYHGVESLEDIYDFMVGKILDALDINNNEFKRWE